MGMCLAAVLCSRSSAAQPAQLAIRFEAGSRVSAGVRARALEEATRVWAPYDVGVHEVPSGAACGGPELAVRFDVDHDLRTTPEDLGEIRFDNHGLPEPLITLYYRSLEALATSIEVRGTAARDWTINMYDAVVGRAVGRALAHEVGHFVLRWMHHPPSGLMRAEHRASGLVDPDPRPFALTDLDLARLAIVRTAAPTFSLPVRPQMPALVAQHVAAPIARDGCGQMVAGGR